MTLSKHIKSTAPGWNVARLSERVGKPQQTLNNWWKHSPEVIVLMVKGLASEAAQ